MIESFYSGRAGLSAHETSMEVVSNNISNVNTTSYKTKKQTFGALLRMSEVRPDTPNSGNLLAGAGATVNNIKKDVSGGSANITDKDTDYFINGDGFFAVEYNGFDDYYTRDGSFQKIVRDDGTYLGTSKGMLVLDANANPIKFDANGNHADPAVYVFDNPAAMSEFGQNLMKPTMASGASNLSTEPPIQGALERSNVDLPEEMVNMITSQRGLQLNSRLVQTADSIEDMINNMGK